MELRCVIYRSENNAKAERSRRDSKIADCEEALIELAGKINKRNLITVDAVQEAAKKIMNHYPDIKTFIHVDVATNEHNAIILSWAWDQEAIIREQRYDGIFALLTNHSKEHVKPANLVRKYRDRNESEINFGDLKGIMDLERVFLQRPERIDAYVFIKILAYFVLAFLRYYAETHGQKGITEGKIQEAFGKIAIGKCVIEPLDIPRFALANDNKLATWFRHSLGLPDPAPYVELLNKLINAEALMDRWVAKWTNRNIDSS
jgi:transposase